MRNYLSGFLAPLLFAAIVSPALLAGCSNTTATSVSQQVFEIAWLPDESGMLAYIDKVSISSLDNSQIEGQNLYHVGSDGSIGNSMNPADAPVNRSGYAPIVSVSPDGHTAIASFINGMGMPDIYRYDLSGGNVTDIIQSSYLLGVSRDMHYAATTTLAANPDYRLIELYDLNSLQPLLPKQTITGPASNRVLWIDGTHYAITIQDSVGSDNTPRSHVAIYNTAGDITQVIPNADVPFHASAYASKSGDLFVRTYTDGIDKINLTTFVRTSVITDDSVNSMDVSSDGTLLVYSSDALNNNGSFPAYAVNVANGHKANIGTSVTTPILSPRADKVAFIHQISGGSSQDIQVTSVSLPN
ncbi:MAG TPA: hypothetical protein VFH95_15740 [Candidatus Kapabacteria bacterium]|nr:hypothetical protein [Candidatus Kapabacteria bacterium]